MKRGRTKHLDFICGDILALEIAYLTAVFLGRLLWPEALISWNLQQGILMVFIMFTVIFFTEGYKDILKRGYLKEMLAVIRQMALILAVEAVYILAFWFEGIYTWWVLCLTLLVGILLIYLERILLKKWLKKKFDKIKYARTIMIISTAEQARRLIAHIQSQTITIFKISGLAVVDQEMKGEQILGVTITANRQEITAFAGSNIIDEVLISVPGDTVYEAELAKQFLQAGLVAHIYMEQRFEELPNRRQEQISGMNVLTCYSREIPLWMLFCKRVIDLAGGIVGSILAVLIGLIIGPIIYIKSPGPIIFSQIRVGRNGRKFRLYKFRSMRLGAEKEQEGLMAQNKMKGHMFKMDDDPRIIPGIGKFIRSTSLGEFPQFFNVLKGDMSLVGTRPPTEAEYQQYSFYQNKRLAMKPGITGMWQVSGRSKITDFDEVVKLDSQYIDSWDIEKDIKIILKTVVVVLKRSGSS